MSLVLSNLTNTTKEEPHFQLLDDIYFFDKENVDSMSAIGDGDLFVTVTDPDAIKTSFMSRSFSIPFTASEQPIKGISFPMHDFDKEIPEISTYDKGEDFLYNSYFASDDTSALPALPALPGEEVVPPLLTTDNELPSPWSTPPLSPSTTPPTSPYGSVPGSFSLPSADVHSSSENTPPSRSVDNLYSSTKPSSAAARSNSPKQVSKTKTSMSRHQIETTSRPPKKRRTLVDRYPETPVMMEATAEDHAVFIGEYSRAERRDKINSYRQKKLNRSKNFVRYRSRKNFAESRPRVGGRFVKMPQSS